MAWDPARYLGYASERERPLYDLVARLPPAPRRIVDLGCGTGNSTAALHKRFPDAMLVGIDSSPAMLARARERSLPCEWIEADLAAAPIPAGTELIFSNAALHWVDDHQRLFPALARSLEAGGILAVQMPFNFSEPSHKLIHALARDGPWRAALVGVLREHPVAPLEDYVALLAPHFETLDVWETRYLHRLTGADPVLSWVMGSALVPVLERLSTDQKETFLASLGDKYRKAYPRAEDGTILFPFRRIFVVARGRR